MPGGGNGLLINRGCVHYLAEQFRGHLGSDDVFKDVHHPAGHGRDAGVDVDGGAGDAFLIFKLQIGAIKLEGDVRHHRGVRHADKVCARLHRQQVVLNGRVDGGLEILELYWRRFVEVRPNPESLKLVHALRKRCFTGSQASAIRAGEAVRFARQAQLFHLREAGVGDVQQGVLLRRVHGETVFTRHRGIDKLDHDVGSDAFQPAVSPDLKRIGGRGAAALVVRPLIGAARGMRFDFVRRSVGDVDAAAVRLPARLARGEAFGGVGDKAVVLFLELVFHSVRSWIPAQPELLDELLHLLGGLEALERSALLVADDVGGIFTEPFPERPLKFLAELLFPFSPLFFRQRLGHGLALLGFAAGVLRLSLTGGRSYQRPCENGA